MDRKLAARHLAQAGRHLRTAERIVVSQRALVAELRDHGHSTERADKILESYEALLEMHRADRDRIRKELEDERKQAARPALIT